MLIFLRYFGLISLFVKAHSRFCTSYITGISPCISSHVEAEDQFFNNITSSCRIKSITHLFYQIRLNPATGPSANPFAFGSHGRRGTQHTIVMMFVGVRVGGGCWSMLDSISIPTYKPYGAGVFHCHANQNSGWAVNSLTPKSMPVGTKTPSSPVGYVEIVRQSYSHPTKTTAMVTPMVKPLPPPAAWV